MSPTDLADFHRFFAYQASPSCDILPHNSPPAKKSVAIRCAGGASKPSGRQRSKSKESVKRPIRAHRCNPCFLIKAPCMVSVSICGIRGRNILVAHGHNPRSTSNISHPTFHIQHLTPIISHPTLHTQHSQHPFPPAKYLCLSSAPAAQSVLLTSTPHGFCVNLWHLREKYSCAAWHIPHSAAPHAKDTFHILNTPPPNLHGFSRRAPPRVQIRHSQRIIATD